MPSQSLGSSYTYADPYLSLWQSAARVALSEEVIRAEDQAADLMAPVQRVHHMASLGVDSTAVLESEVEPEGVVKDCADIAAKFLWAEITRNHARSQFFRDELAKAICDAGGWSTCLATYLKFKAEGGNWPYRSNVDAVFPLNGPVVAVVGDWGTGEHLASTVLQEIKKFSPNLFIHLGDIYYSGTQNETRTNFLSICEDILGKGMPVFSLCGNHDMYSGGSGYYWLVDQLGQKASYFCIRSPQWQILAMDTGHDDRDPFTVATNMTKIAATEEAWLKDKIETADRRHTILLSHHQLFSAFAPVGRVDGKEYAYNPNLYRSFEGILNRIEWWFWGHEHNLAVYKPYMGLRRGRCIGCSAVPVLMSQQSYTLRKDLKTWRTAGYPSWRSEAELGNNGTDYNHAFAILTLKEHTGTAEYYEVQVRGSASPMLKEAIEF